MAAIQPKGWWLVAYTAVVVGGLVGAILAQSGVTAEGLHLVLRATARTSLVLFLAAFVAAPLRAIRPGGLADWLAENRRYLGVSFAASHSFHFAAIIGLTRLADKPPDVVVVVLGTIGYLFILAMAATSFDVTTAWLGAKRWKRLHTTGLYYLWAVFTLTFLGSIEKDPSAALCVALLLGAMALRIRRGVSLRVRPVSAH